MGSTKPRIAIGSDHAGFSVKEAIRAYLERAGYAVSDRGTSSDQAVDYPDYGQALGRRVVTTDYLGGRHQRRLDKIAAIEREERAQAAKR